MLQKYDCSQLLLGESREEFNSAEGWPPMFELAPGVEFLGNERKNNPFSGLPFAWPFALADKGGNIFEAIHLRIDDIVLRCCSV